MPINLGVKRIFLEIEDTGESILEVPCVSDWVFCSTIVSHLDDKIYKTNPVTSMIRSALKEKIPINHLHCLLWWCWDCCSFSLDSQSSLEIQNNPNIVFCHLLVDDGLVAER